MDIVQGRASPDWNWEAIVSELWPRLVRTGQLRFGLSAEECEDAIQNVAVAITRTRPRAVRPPAYLARAFLRECVRRKNVVRSRARSEWTILEHDRPLDPRYHLLITCEVNAALSRLSPRCRELLKKHVMEGYTLPESADATGLSRITVWKRFRECVERMVRWLR